MNTQTEINLTEHYQPADILLCGSRAGCAEKAQFVCACGMPICGTHSYDLDGNRDVSAETGRHCRVCVDEWQREKAV